MMPHMQVKLRHLRFAQDAIAFKSMTPDELTKLFEVEIARWRAVVHDSGLNRG